MSVIDVIDSNEFKSSTSTGFAVVDYSAVWCGPCKRVEPVFRELAQNNKKIKFLHIDIDHASETEGLSDVVNKIRSVPTFHFYRDGKIIDVLSGGNIAQLKSKVDSLSLLVASQQQNEDNNKKFEKSDEKTNQPTVIEINSFDEFKSYLISGLAIVDYSATWCGPCKRLEPVFKELATTNRNIKFLHIDIDHASETEGLNRLVGAIRSVPTFHFYRDGKVVDTLSGANIIQLKNKVEYLSSLAPQVVPAEAKVEDKKREQEKEDKVEKKKVKTSEEGDEKREKFKSKSPDHHKEEDNKRIRESSRKREPKVAVEEKKDDHAHERAEQNHTPGTVIEVEDSIQLINLTQSGLAVIDYSATWCGPCKIVAPVYKELATHYRTIKFLHIDIDHAAETEGLSELVDKIRSVPTFHFYRDGKIIDFLYGGNVSQLKIKIDALNTLGAMVAAQQAANEKKAAFLNAAAAVAAANNAAAAAAAAANAVITNPVDDKPDPKKIKPPIAPTSATAAVVGQAAPVTVTPIAQEEKKDKAIVAPAQTTAFAQQPAQIAVAVPAVHNIAAASVITAVTAAATAAAISNLPPAQPLIAQANPTNEEDQKKVAVAAAAIIAANVPKITEEKKEETKTDNETANMINPIIDVYNSIEFINATAAGLALVDYSAVWCPPCVRVQPILKDIAQNYKNIKFIHVDIDHAADTDLAELVDKISSVPTFHFYADGRVVDTLQGANIAQLRTKVENLNISNGNPALQPKKDDEKKEHKKKSKSSEEKKAADKKKKKKSKKKEKEAKEAKEKAAAVANSTATVAATTNKEKSTADATSAATTASIINSNSNTKVDNPPDN